MVRVKDPPFDFCTCVDGSHPNHNGDPCLNPAAVNEQGQFLHDRRCYECAELDMEP